MTNILEINTENFNAKEYTIKELADNPNFPWKERSIRAFIASGELLTLQGANRFKVIPAFELKRFLKKRMEAMQSKIDLFFN